MANLTQEQKLVRFVPAIDSVPDHYLVIYKQTARGPEFRACLLPGETLKKRIFESPASFTSYAVPRDEHLRHRFNRDYKTHDQLHSFKLFFTVEYRINNPVFLVEKLHQDPVRHIEREIEDVLDRLKTSVDWSAVEKEEIDLEQILFLIPPRGEAISNLERLRQFAQGYGFEIHRILVNRRLPDQEIHGSLATVRARQYREAIVAHHTLKETEKVLDQDLKHHIDGRQGAFDRSQLVAGSFASNVARSMDQITDGIHSIHDLRDVVRETGALRASIMSIAGGGELPPASASPPPIASGAHSTPNDSGGSPKRYLEKICDQIGQVACEPDRRRQLLSATLHRIAEALRGKEANSATLEQYSRAIGAHMEELLPILDRTQIQLLHDIQDDQKLQRYLVGGD